MPALPENLVSTRRLIYSTLCARPVFSTKNTPKMGLPSASRGICPCVFGIYFPCRRSESFPSQVSFFCGPATIYFPMRNCIFIDYQWFEQFVVQMWFKSSSNNFLVASTKTELEWLWWDLREHIQVRFQKCNHYSFVGQTGEWFTAKWVNSLSISVCVMVKISQIYAVNKR